MISAISALDNFITDNPGSEYREEAFFYRMKAASNLAFNSTTSRMEGRLSEAMEAYNALMKSYPDTKYSKEAIAIFNKMEKEMKGFKKAAK